MIINRVAVLLVGTCLLSLGCGETKSVTVGDGESKGAYKRGIDSAGDVAGKASESVRSGEKDLSGG
jgi:hypothetical protein